MRFIHNWLITGIQWMMCWWVDGSLCLLPTSHFPKPGTQAKASIWRHQNIGIPKYGKDEKWCQNMVKMKRDAKICNCRHIKKYEKNIKNSKSSIRFLSHVSPHHKDKKIWSHHIYAIGSIKSTFHKGEAQIFLFFSFTSHQIRLNPIVTDRQPTYFTIFKKRLWLELVIGITLKLVIVIHLR